MERVWRTALKIDSLPFLFRPNEHYPLLIQILVYIISVICVFDMTSDLGFLGNSSTVTNVVSSVEIFST